MQRVPATAPFLRTVLMCRIMVTSRDMVLQTASLRPSSLALHLPGASGTPTLRTPPIERWLFNHQPARYCDGNHRQCAQDGKFVRTQWPPDRYGRLSHWPAVDIDSVRNIPGQFPQSIRVAVNERRVAQRRTKEQVAYLQRRIRYRDCPCQHKARDCIVRAQRKVGLAQPRQRAGQEHEPQQTEKCSGVSRQRLAAAPRDRLRGAATESMPRQRSIGCAACAHPSRQLRR